MLRAYSSSDILALEEKYGSFNYHPIPVVLAKGKGKFVHHRPVRIPPLFERYPNLYRRHVSS